jgi:hypothetical protein
MLNGKLPSSIPTDTVSIPQGNLISILQNIFSLLRSLDPSLQNHGSCSNPSDTEDQERKDKEDIKYLAILTRLDCIFVKVERSKEGPQQFSQVRA